MARMRKAKLSQMFSEGKYVWHILQRRKEDACVLHVRVYVCDCYSFTAKVRIMCFVQEIDFCVIESPMARRLKAT